MARFAAESRRAEQARSDGDGRRGGTSIRHEDRRVRARCAAAVGELSRAKRPLRPFFDAMPKPSASCCKCNPAAASALDALPQIRLFAKLKLTKCVLIHPGRVRILAPGNPHRVAR